MRLTEVVEETKVEITSINTLQMVCNAVEADFATRDCVYTNFAGAVLSPGPTLATQTMFIMLNPV